MKTVRLIQIKPWSHVEVIYEVDGKEHYADIASELYPEELHEYLRSLTDDQIAEFISYQINDTINLIT